MGTWGWGKKQKMLGLRDTWVGMTTYCPVPFFALEFAFLQIKLISNLVYSPPPTCKEVEKRSLCPEKGHAGKVTHGCAHGYPCLSSIVQESPGPLLLRDCSFPWLTFLLLALPTDPSSSPGHSATGPRRTWSNAGQPQGKLAQLGLSGCRCLKIVGVWGSSPIPA